MIALQLYTVSGEWYRFSFFLMTKSCPCCVYSTFSHLFLHWLTHRLILWLGFCEQHCNNHECADTSIGCLLWLFVVFHISYLKSATEILTLGFNSLKLIHIKNFKLDLKCLWAFHYLIHSQSKSNHNLKIWAVFLSSLLTNGVTKVQGG